MDTRRTNFLVAIAFLCGFVGLWRVAHGDPPLGPSLTTKDNSTTVSNTHTLKFTSGCTVTANGSEADVVCTGTGGGVTSVTGSSGVTCTPTTGAVVCSASTGTPSGSAFFGDGSSGVCNFAGGTVCGLTPSGSVYTMSGDLATADGSGVANGFTLITAGAAVYCNGTFTIASGGTMKFDGNAPPGGSGSGATNTVPNGNSAWCFNVNCGSQGGNGQSSTAGAGGNGGIGSNFSAGGIGGAGGGDGTHGGGAGGTTSSNSTTFPSVHGPWALFGITHNAGGSLFPIVGGTGGGGGALLNSVANDFSGGGGSGGGSMFIYVKNFVVNGSLHATGGVGGPVHCASNSAGGGGGGGGGYVEVVYNTISGSSTPLLATNVVPGGAGSAHCGASGVDGSPGNTGTLVLVQN